MSMTKFTTFLLFREVKMSVFVSELEKGRKSVQFLMQRVPHVIPFKEVSRNVTWSNGGG